MSGCRTHAAIKVPNQIQGFGVQNQKATHAGDVSNEAALFWALVVNNVLIALGLPVVGGLFWYKRRQMIHKA